MPSQQGCGAPRKQTKAYATCAGFWKANPSRNQSNTSFLTAPGLNAHRAFILATCSTAGQRSILSMSKSTFIATLTGRIVFGSTVTEDDMYRAPPDIIAQFSAAVGCTRCNALQAYSKCYPGTTRPTTLFRPKPDTQHRHHSFYASSQVCPFPSGPRRKAPEHHVPRMDPIPIAHGQVGSSLARKWRLLQHEHFPPYIALPAPQTN